MDDQALSDPFLPEELRLFIACELPEDWLTALAEASRTLAKNGLGSLRWVRPEGMHLTLKFLGDAGRHLLPDISDALHTASHSQPAFNLTLGELGSFGGRRGVRVVWAGVDGDVKALQNLQRRVDDAVAELGFAREIRPYSPHLTLARVPESAPSDIGARIAAALRQVKPVETAPFAVCETSLIRSQLGPGGARYTRLTSAALG
jgi:RNA 2',3'-cyclic 3'-phosphodiesterase